MKDLKEVCKAPTEEVATIKLEEFEDKWGKKYTTNAMENFNRQLRKVTKSKTIYTNDYALMKSPYLEMTDVSSKWKGRIRNWDIVIAQLSIYFEGRI